MGTENIKFHKQKGERLRKPELKAVICHALLVSGKPDFCPPSILKAGADSPRWYLLITASISKYQGPCYRLTLGDNVGFVNSGVWNLALHCILKIPKQTTGGLLIFFHVLVCLNCSFNHEFCMSKVLFMLPVQRNFTFQKWGFPVILIIKF